MSKKALNKIKLLAVVFIASFLANILFYANLIQVQGFMEYAIVLTLVFSLLIITTFFTMFGHEWARRMTVYGSLIVAFNLIFLIIFSPYEALIPYIHIFMCIGVALGFNYSGNRGQFVSALPKEGADWKSVLVIDDDEILIKMIRPILLNNGFAALSARTGEEGLLIAQKQKPDLILLDVIMPAMKGREVCCCLKEDPDTKHIPVVFLTAKNSPDDIKAEMEAGAETHLTKPVNPNVLLATIRDILK